DNWFKSNVKTKSFINTNTFAAYLTEETEEPLQVEDWMLKHEKLMAHWQKLVASLKSSTALNYTMFFVATRTLRDLIQRIEKAC
ncbi:MAG: hypothetical protein Q8L68_00550, partial [Methylococcales bacterium]|nr:hypothetical protein [Methylococcales bacterium]